MKDVGNLNNTETQALNIPVVSGSVFDDKIDEWHNSDTPLSLYEYLGLTEEQFKIWLKTPEEIEKHYR
jgi:hypothetical protein